MIFIECGAIVGRRIDSIVLNVMVQFFFNSFFGGFSIRENDNSHNYAIWLFYTIQNYVGDWEEKYYQWNDMSPNKCHLWYVPLVQFNNERHAYNQPT